MKKKSPDGKPCMITGKEESRLWYHWPQDNPTGYICQNAYAKERRKIKQQQKKEEIKEETKVEKITLVERPVEITTEVIKPIVPKVILQKVVLPQTRRREVPRFSDSNLQRPNLKAYTRTPDRFR
jgi:hypothetical protein